MTQEERIHHIKLKITNAVLSCVILDMDLDEITTQPFYKQELKSAVNNARKELEKVMNKEFVRMLNVNETVIQNLLDNNQALIHRIVSLSPSQRLEANQVLSDHFSSGKEFNLELINLTA